MTQAKSNNKNMSLKPFFSLILSTEIPKLMLIGGLIGSVITTLTGLVVPLLTKNLVDHFSINMLQVNMIIAIGIIFIIQAIINGLSMYWLAAVGHKIVAQLREKMWNKLIRLPVKYFDTTSSGKTVSRVVNDTSVVKDLVSDHFPQFISGIISIIGAVIILFVLDWKMTLIMLLSVPVTIFIMIPLGRRMGKISRRMQDETAVFTGDVQQTLGEIRLMKASNAEKTEKKKGYQGISKLLNLGFKEAKIYAFIGPLMNLIMMVVIVIIISYGGMRVASNTMSTGELVAFLLYLFQIIMPITSFAMFFTNLQKAKGATERIIEILEKPLENGQDGLDLDISNQPITVKHVSFSYQDENPVLQDISFHANPGEMIAFAGPSGSGKTTMFGLLERYYEPERGDILIGDTPIHQLSLQSWRSQIGYVSQDSPMMAGTIRDNLCYGLEDEQISDKQLWKVAKSAYADQFIKEFPSGLDT